LKFTADLTNITSGLVGDQHTSANTDEKNEVRTLKAVDRYGSKPETVSHFRRATRPRLTRSRGRTATREARRPARCGYWPRRRRGRHRPPCCRLLLLLLSPWQRWQRMRFSEEDEVMAGVPRLSTARLAPGTRSRRVSNTASDNENNQIRVYLKTTP